MRELTRAPALSPHRSFCHQTWQHGGSVVKGKNKVWSGTSFSESGRVHVLNCPKLAPAELQMNWGPVAWGMEEGGEGGLGGTCPEHHQSEPIAGHEIDALQVPCTFSVTCPYLLPRSAR